MSQSELCKLVDLPIIQDERGKLSFIEGEVHAPFEIRRVFYLYGVPAGASRGGHAHKELKQFFVCVSGIVKLLVDDGKSERAFELSDPWVGLYIPPGIWVSSIEFSVDSVCMVLASDIFKESDYIRNYNDFTEWRKAERE